MAHTLGTRITENRKRIQLSQEQLAAQMGISSQAVSKWENDISCPDITLLPQLADCFGVTIDELLRGRGNDVARLLPENERKDAGNMLLKVNVLSNSGDVVKMNLPLALVKLGLELGAGEFNINGGGNMKALNDIDFNALVAAAELGVMGKLLEVKSSNGDLVEIYIE